MPLLIGVPSWAGSHLLWTYGWLAAWTLLAALPLAAAVWFCRRRGRRGVLLVPVLAAALLLGTCGVAVAGQVKRDVQQIALARRMGVSVRDPLFTQMFPADYLMSEEVLGRGRTTRHEVHAITRHTTARYRCPRGEEAFIYYGTVWDPPRTVSIVVRYDEDRVRDVWSYNDSLRLFTGGCEWF